MKEESAMKASKLKRMVIEPAQPGHFIVHHEMPMKMSGKSPAFMEQERVKPMTFGPKEHQALMDHVHEHLALNTAAPEGTKEHDAEVTEHMGREEEADA